MFAVIRTGGKQYKVAKDDVLEIERIEAKAGDKIDLGDVLMVGGEGAPKVGSPLVQGATVKAEVVEQTRGPKLTIFKKRRRQNYRRKNGHRQDLTLVRILDIAG
ncbi:MAG: 50S ribosomal protein L21 [Parvibaculum sp.]|uniref:50S ribosomal protein L21 n=1 Tax=Parvibaculum sp. TaxID=2024848 RepID=UPI00271A9A45|nr:50S ribosomal protein L21 [Parvibaculum sp.]MDO8837788.1 50S ribosomal protein L21 [Parvibaculum sp.]